MKRILDVVRQRRGNERRAGDRVLIGMDVLLVGVMCGWRGRSWYLLLALLRFNYQRPCSCLSFTPASCKDPSTRSTKQGAFRIWKWCSTWQFQVNSVICFPAIYPQSSAAQLDFSSESKGLWISPPVNIFKRWLHLFPSSSQLCCEGDGHCEKSVVYMKSPKSSHFLRSVS